MKSFCEENSAGIFQDIIKPYLGRFIIYGDDRVS